ncbi:hypothetical protein CF165_40225 [Amycolatopsis vastitatis]|uniref:Uncharacterized protein n=1 Tax=Amycolatopsis vastitatis TaxID=1905142 RepID=A0A229SQR3_9PSEU|nr:hypothetical protein CF165_40225 [Amycolatopsis vastitatis]
MGVAPQRPALLGVGAFIAGAQDARYFSARSAPVTGADHAPARREVSEPCQTSGTAGMRVLWLRVLEKYRVHKVRFTRHFHMVTSGYSNVDTEPQAPRAGAASWELTRPLGP